MTEPSPLREGNRGLLGPHRVRDPCGDARVSGAESLVPTPTVPSPCRLRSTTPRVDSVCRDDGGGSDFPVRVSCWKSTLATGSSV